MVYIKVYVIASEEDKKYVDEFMTMLAPQRRSNNWQYTIFDPAYVEKTKKDGDEMEELEELNRYIVVGCMSSTMLARLLDHPRLIRFIEGATAAVPLVLKPCDWQSKLSPFANKGEFVHDLIVQNTNHNTAFAEVARELRALVQRLRMEYE